MITLNFNTLKYIKTIISFIILPSCMLFFFNCTQNKQQEQEENHLNHTQKIEPELAENWWQIAGVPDIGEYNHDKMEPVDFAIWQAADGTWQLVSCIRYCGKEADFRVLHRWEGKTLTSTNWEPKGIFMVADSTLGEEHGWIQAPYVVKKDGKFKFYYGGGGQICMAESTDGKIFERIINADGKTSLFRSEEYDRARDIMIMNYKDTYFGYYTGSVSYSWPDSTKGAVFCRKSADLKNWGEEIKVSETEEDVVAFLSSECPQVIHKNGKFFLFKTQEYKPGFQRTTIFCSDDPLDFGVNTDELKLKTIPVAAPEIINHENKYYVAALMPDLKGIRITELFWKEDQQL